MKTSRILALLTAFSVGLTGPMALAAGGSVTGTVVDDARKAVASMAVRATDVVDPSKSFTALTDESGKFSFASLPSGSYLVSADTVNTAWIQKDDSPVVEVSASASPNVTLVLVKTAELMPEEMDHGSKKLELITLGMATVGTVLGVVAVVNLDELESDNDRLNLRIQDLEGLREALLQRIDQLQQELNRLRERGDENSREQLERIAELQRQIEQLQRELRQLRGIIDRRLPASPR